MQNKETSGMKKLSIIMIVLVVCSISGCDQAADHIWDEYIWGVEKKSFDPALLDTGLPIITIDTEGSKIINSRENYIDAKITIDDPIDSDNDLEETETQIRGRGNTTWWYPKKPCRIKFYDKQNLFGLTKAKSWVLLANHQDPTLMMNTIAFELGRRMELPCTNHAVHVELILNGVYEGSYVLTEQVQAGKGRVDIDEDEGFLVELDSYYDEEPKFTTRIYQLPIMIKSPEDLTDPAGYDFVKDAVNELEAALYNNAGPSPDPAYRELIDIENAAKFLLINEIVGNSEAGIPKSVYMYKDKGSGEKISMGPLWDFDWGFGYSGKGNVYFEDSSYSVNWHPFFKRFFDDPVFVEKHKEIWNQYYNDIRGIISFIEETAAKLEASQRANFSLWQWDNKPNYTNEINKMKNWWNNRISCLNSAVNTPRTE
jgi:spore coat protein CotH